MKEGDFILIEFTGRVRLTGEVFDLSSREGARKAGIYNEKHKYGPGLVVIGAGMAVPGVEEQLKDMRPGEEREFEVPSGKAFGPRNPKLIKIISIANFYRQDMNPVPGAFVNIDGRDCRIKTVSGGRVMVDFNHPLAGKDLLYRVRIVRKISDPEEKADRLLDHYGLRCEKALDKEKGILSVKTDKPMPPAFQALFRKNIRKWIPQIREIGFSAKERKGEAPAGPAKAGAIGEARGEGNP